MIEFFRTPAYDFMGQRRWAYWASLAFTCVALLSLGLNGLRYDIDFTGGTLVQLRFEGTPRIAEIWAALATIGFGESIIQDFAILRSSS